MFLIARLITIINFSHPADLLSLSLQLEETNVLILLMIWEKQFHCHSPCHVRVIECCHCPSTVIDNHLEFMTVSLEESVEPFGCVRVVSF